ncbi:MAG: Rrf2 family transcriptional regulator [Chloroflexi bacterium]|nr:Rrf2 family transcriptional regulator [Chloroflexota bacterium]
MKLSLCSEYALLCLIHLARPNHGAPTLESISDSQHIPAEILNETLFVLKKARYIKTSQRIQLAKPASRITVLEIIRLFDGALAPMEPVSIKGYDVAPMESEPKLSGLFSQIQDYISNQLEHTTIADFV